MRGLLFACLLLAGCAPAASATARPTPSTALVSPFTATPQPQPSPFVGIPFPAGTATPQTRAGNGFYEGPAIVRGQEYTDCAVRLPCVSFLYLQPTANVILTDASGRSYGRVNPTTRIVGVVSSDRNFYVDRRLPSDSGRQWLGIPVYVVLTEDGEPSDHQGMVMYWLTSIVCLTDCVK